MGALDDHLLPSIKELPEKNLIVKSKESASDAGTTKELYGITWIHALSGTWGEKVDGAIFQAYKFDFLSNIPGELYSGFVLLLETKLDDDVGILNWSFTWSQRSLSLLYLFVGKRIWMQNR